MTTSTEMSAASYNLPREVELQEFVEDPYPVYQKMLQVPPWRAPSGGIVVARYSTVRQVLADPISYGQHAYPWPNFHHMDPPDHTRLRRLVSKAFTPRSIKALEPEIGNISDDLLKSKVGSDKFDLMNDYAYPLTTSVIAHILGVPAEDAKLWRDWHVRKVTFTSGNSFSGAQEGDLAALKEDAECAFAEQADYLLEIVLRRQEQKGDDIVSRLIDARDLEDRLDQEEVLHVLALMLNAGMHTTATQIGKVMYVLLQHPDQLEALRQEIDLLENAVEEGLRHSGVLQTETRLTRVPSTIEGVEIAEGEHIITVNAAANRDPEKYDRPDEFDIRRLNADSHLGFGFGIHQCIGAALARAELRTAVSDLLINRTDLGLAGPPRRDPLFRLRGFEFIPVTWGQRASSK
jgi:cytochrome P450